MYSFFIGQEVTEEHIFSQEDVKEFATLSGDNNPIHLDEKYAARTRYGKPIVHGILITGLFSKLIGTQLPGEGSIYLEQNTQFCKPVYVGEKVITRVRIIDVNLETNRLELETNVYNTKRELVIKGTAKVLYQSSLSA